MKAEEKKAIEILAKYDCKYKRKKTDDWIIEMLCEFAEEQREEAERDVLKWWFGKGISDERLNEILEDYKSNSNEQQVPTTN